MTQAMAVLIQSVAQAPEDGSSVRRLGDHDEGRKL